MPVQSSQLGHPLLDVAAKIATKVNDMLRYEHLTFGQMIFLTQNAALDQSFVARWVPTLRKMQAGGRAAYDPITLSAWNAEMRSQFAMKLGAQGNLPHKFTALYAEYLLSNTSSWFAHNPHRFVMQMVRAGRSMIIDGDLDMGKTATSLLAYYWLHHLHDEHKRMKTEVVAEGQKRQESDLERIWADVTGGKYKNDGLGLLYANRLKLIANVTVKPGSPFFDDYQFAPSLEDVVICLSQNSIDGNMTYLLFDEAGFNINKKRGNSRPVFAIESIFRLVRKFNCCVCVVTQNAKNDLPPFLRDDNRTAKTTIAKIEQQVAEVFVEKSETLEHVRIRNMPDSPMPFETRGLAAMTVDMDAQDLAGQMEQERFRTQKEGHVFTPNDMYRFALAYATGVKEQAQIEREKGRKAAAEAVEFQLSPAVISAVRSKYGTINPMTGSLWSVREMAETFEVVPAQIEAITRRIDEERKKAAENPIKPIDPKKRRKKVKVETFHPEPPPPPDVVGDSSTGSPPSEPASISEAANAAPPGDAYAVTPGTEDADDDSAPPPD